MDDSSNRGRCLVTGGAGFIGSHFIRKSLRKGLRVMNLDKLTYAGHHENLNDVSGSPHYDFMQVDLTDTEAVRAAIMKFKPDQVVHFAAESHVDRSIDLPLDCVRSNILGTAALLDEITRYWRELDEPTRRRFRFLHVSTDEVYGALSEAGVFSEASPCAPRSPYSASKAASDHLVNAWHTTYGLPVMIGRATNNYGPYQFPEKLIPMVIMKVLRGEPIPIYGNGEHVRDWLHVEDHCDALDRIIEAGRVGESYNIGSGNEMRNIDLVRMICRCMDEIRPQERGMKAEYSIVFVEDRPGHDFRYALDFTKIRTELGWKPAWSFEKGIRNTIEWVVENPDWCDQVLAGTYGLERLGRG